MQHFNKEIGEFTDELNSVLMPRSAIKNARLLKGRERELHEVVQELALSGTSAFIHGLRGVGKTSLAFSAADEFINKYKVGKQTNIVDVICDKNSSFHSILHDLLNKAVGSDPTVTSLETKSSASLGFDAIKASRDIRSTFGPIPVPINVNHAIELLSYIENKYNTNYIFIIDEFDQLTSHEAHYDFGIFSKVLAEQNLKCKFIYTGVGEDLTQLFKAHESALRYFRPWSLDRLSKQALIDIGKSACEHFDIGIDDTTVYRVANICDGFPYFTHLIYTKMILALYDAKNEGIFDINNQIYDRAIPASIESVEAQLSQPYSMAALKHKVNGEIILWSVADHDNLERRTRDVYNDGYLPIHDSYFSKYDKPEKPLSPGQFNSRIANFCKPEYGEVLIRPRQAFVAFREKRMRGLARLKAARQGIELQADHPFSRPAPVW